MPAIRTRTNRFTRRADTVSGSPWGPPHAPQPDAGPTRWHLDLLSRRAIRWFLVRLCSITLLALLGATQDGQQLARGFASLLSMTCGVGSCVCAVLGTWLREPFGKGSLNIWDEALAFVALSRLAHFALGLQA